MAYRLQVDDPVYACKGERKEFSVQVAGGGIYQYELLEVSVGCNNVNDVKNNIINSWAGFSKISIPVNSPGKYIWRFKNECCNGEWKYSAFMTLRIDETPSFVSVKILSVLLYKHKPDHLPALPDRPVH